jgi:hypothetical protein
MILTGARVFLRAGAVDFRKGPDGLVALVRDAFACSPSVWSNRISSGRRRGAQRSG